MHYIIEISFHIHEGKEVKLRDHKANIIRERGGPSRGCVRQSFQIYIDRLIFHVYSGVGELVCTVIIVIHEQELISFPNDFSFPART